MVDGLSIFSLIGTASLCCMRVCRPHTYDRNNNYRLCLTNLRLRYRAILFPVNVTTIGRSQTDINCWYCAHNIIVIECPGPIMKLIIYLKVLTDIIMIFTYV